LAAAYPGTPSSEVPMALSRIAKKVGFYFEYSSNEKIAFETAAGAAWSGVRSITAMKHFGLNVASDSVLPVAFTGVKAGLVIMVSDDPHGWSSAQSEQDSRYFSRMAKIPTIEPSNPQECLDYTKFAFDLSEEFEMPVFLRTTTKVSHSIGTVKLGELKKIKDKGIFEKDDSRYYTIRPNLQILHDKLNKKIENIEKKYGKVLNKTFSGKGKIGIITSGASFEYVKEILQEFKLNPPIAKIGLSHPISKSFISNFIKDKKVVLVLEELEPIIENFVNRVAKDANPKIIVHGKDLLSRSGEYNVETIIPALEKVFNKKYGIDLNDHKNKLDKILKGLPPRKPVFCSGCPHRSTFYAVKKVFGNNTIYAGDVGCYLLGIFEPFKMQDFMISMGASLGLSHGITKVTDQEVVAFIGDSTFFHSSMPGLVNFKFNNGKSPLVIVMDNSITAMTGHQPHPGSGFTGMGDKVQPVKIEQIAEALGAEVVVANSFSQKQLIKALEKLKDIKGPRVLVSKGECRLLTKRKYSRQGEKFTKFQINQEKCKKCGVCTGAFACPTIMEIIDESGSKVYKINTDMCLGCGVCMQICPNKAIQPIKEGRK